MTGREMQELLNREATLEEGGLTWAVTINDVKAGGWGRTLVEVIPVAGEGAKWVELGRVRIR